MLARSILLGLLLPRSSASPSAVGSPQSAGVIFQEPFVSVPTLHQARLEDGAYVSLSLPRPLVVPVL